MDDLKFDTLPNRLTLLRMAFVPLVVGLLFIRTPAGDLAAAIVFGLAAITDYFDGYFARTRKQVTVYGKLMDPLADKFLVSSALIMLQYIGRIHPVVVIILICREMAITGLRALASSEGVIISASGGGKVKTTLQMVAIALIILREQIYGDILYAVGMTALYLSLALSLWSAKDYIVTFFRALHESRQHKVHERRLAREARIAARSARIARREEIRRRSTNEPRID